MEEDQAADQTLRRARDASSAAMTGPSGPTRTMKADKNESRNKKESHLRSPTSLAYAAKARVPQDSPNASDGIVDSWELKQFANEPLLSSFLSPDLCRDRQREDARLSPFPPHEMKECKKRLEGKGTSGSSSLMTPIQHSRGQEPRAAPSITAARDLEHKVLNDEASKNKGSTRTASVPPSAIRKTVDYASDTSNKLVPPFSSQIYPAPDEQQDEGAFKDQGFTLTATIPAAATPSGIDDETALLSPDSDAEKKRDTEKCKKPRKGKLSGGETPDVVPPVEKDSLSIIRRKRSLRHGRLQEKSPTPVSPSFVKVPEFRSPTDSDTDMSDVEQIGERKKTTAIEQCTSRMQIQDGDTDVSAIKDDQERVDSMDKTLQGKKGVPVERDTPPGRLRENSTDVIAPKNAQKTDDNINPIAQQRKRSGSRLPFKRRSLSEVEDQKQKLTRSYKRNSMFYGKSSGLNGRKSPSEREMTPPDRHRCKLFMRRCTEHLLLGLLVGGIGGGLALGHVLRWLGILWTARPVMYLAFPGELLLRMLSGISLPLLISSVIAAMGSIQLRMLARVSSWTLLFWTAMKVLAVTTGVAVTSALMPGMSGRTVSIPPVPPVRSSFLAVDKVLDLLRNLFPSNVIEACVFTTYTQLAPAPSTDIEAIRNTSSIESWHFSLVKDYRPNQLGLIMFCSLIGVVLSAVQEEHNAVLNFFVSLSNAIMIVTQIIMWYSPIGVCCLIASNVVREPVLSWQLDPLWTALLVALGVHALVTLPLMYAIFVRRRCIQFFMNLISPVATAFGTGSSFLAVPASISALEDSPTLDPRVVRLIVSLGATINKDGTTISATVLLFYFVQRYQLPLVPLDYVLLGTLAVLGSIGASTVRTDPMTPFIFLLDAAGLPTEEASLLLLLHWSIARLGKAVNVLGDAVSAAVVQSLCGDLLVPEAEHHREAATKEAPTSG